MARQIAIVEDETAIRENYAEAFRRQGYNVAAFADRQSALARFRERLPDLAILNIGLGHEVEGGFDLCRDIRHLSSSLPIIFLTANVLEEEVAQGDGMIGGYPFIAKPATIPEIIKSIEQNLS